MVNTLVDLFRLTALMLITLLLAMSLIDIQHCFSLLFTATSKTELNLALVQMQAHIAPVVWCSFKATKEILWRVSVFTAIL